MKQKMLLFLFMAFIPIAMNADPILINGIYYNINTSARTAEVTSGNNSYTGNVTIPQTFSYGGSLYTVKSIGAGLRQDGVATRIIVQLIGPCMR